MKRAYLAIALSAFAFLLASCGGGGGVTPPPVTDTTAPTISRVAVEPSALVVSGTTEVRVEADVTDDVGVASVTARVEYPDGTSQTHSLSLASGSTYAVQFTATWSGSNPGTLRFTVSASDAAGNTQSAAAQERRGASPPPDSPW